MASQYCRKGHDKELVGRDNLNRCSECRKNRIKKYRDANKEKVAIQSNRHKWLKRYGLTGQGYDEMLLSQQGKCAICKSIPQQKRAMAVDHCHKTGRIRGLLCGNCNAMLGMAKDNPSILLNAVEYLS